MTLFIKTEEKKGVSVPETQRLIGTPNHQENECVVLVSPTHSQHFSVTHEYEGFEEAGDADKKRKDLLIRNIKYTVSFCFMSFCLIFISRGIFRRETPVSMGAGPIVAFCVMWLLIAWLGMLEGGQGSLVGLQPIDRELYKESHKSAYKCSGLVCNGDSLNSFIVGRQFLVVLVVFCLNLVCTPIEAPPPPPDGGPLGAPPLPPLDKGFLESFLDSGLPVMLITVILGQLAAEVNATNCMLDFINTPLMVVTTWICLAIEASGLLHATYLVNCFFHLFDDEPSSPEKEESKTTKEQAGYWGRTVLSTFLLGGALTVTWVALLSGQTTMPLSGATSRIIAFIVLSCFLGILEAMQIAVFAVSKLPESELANYPTAHANSKLVFQGHNFKAFLTGRQICVTMSMFLLARLTTTQVRPTETVMGISDDLQFFFNTGLPGALITTIVASLFWRIVASSYPIPFLANPTVKLTIQTCLALEASGIFSISWLLADVIRNLMDFRTDDSYLVKGKMESNHSWETSSTDEESAMLSDRAPSQEDFTFTSYGTTEVQSQ
ncbi:MAG: hypothetical protein SGBAC_008447 [Bacillariaceae sp.]